MKSSTQFRSSSVFVLFWNHRIILISLEPRIQTVCLWFKEYLELWKISNFVFLWNFRGERKKLAKFKLSTKVDLFLLLNMIEDTIIQMHRKIFYFLFFFFFVSIYSKFMKIVFIENFVQFHCYKENSICYSFKFSNAVNVNPVCF